MKVKDLIKRLEDYLPDTEVNIEIQDKKKHVWYIADKKSIWVETHTLTPKTVFIYGAIKGEEV